MKRDEKRFRLKGDLIGKGLFDRGNSIWARREASGSEDEYDEKEEVVWSDRRGRERGVEEYEREEKKFGKGRREV